MKLSDYVSQEELRRLLSGLVVFLVAVSIFLLFGFTVVPGLRNANRPAASAPVAGVVRDSGWMDPAELAPQKSYEVPPLDPKDYLEPTPALLEIGKQLYTKNCAQCHGAEGRADGPGAQGVNPPPRDFTSREGWKNGYDRLGIYRTLAEGISGSSMASYDFLAKKERMALVHTVRSLGSLAETGGDPASEKKLSDLLASAGETVPNKIPVSLAIEKLVEEAPEVAPLPLPPADDAKPGAVLLRRVVHDPRRAALTLRAAPGWRDGVERLARLVADGAPSNGFSTETVKLTPAEWQLLQERLITTVSR